MKVGTPSVCLAGGVHKDSFRCTYDADQRPFRQHFFAADTSSLWDVLDLRGAILDHQSFLSVCC